MHIIAEKQPIIIVGVFSSTKIRMSIVSHTCARQIAMMHHTFSGNILIISCRSLGNAERYIKLREAPDGSRVR